MRRVERAMKLAALIVLSLPSAHAVTPISDVLQIASGSTHTCAVKMSGGGICWGSNYSGELGDNSKTNRIVPVSVTDLTSGVAAIAAGGGHTCALTTAGGVKCWGGNRYGELGDGTTTDRFTPVDVSGLTSGVVSIAAGTFHTCALTTAGGVKCWGWNGWSQLGDGSTTDRLTPVDVSGLSSGVAAIAAGYVHTCALTTASGVQCWGRGTEGQLGAGSNLHGWTPVDVAGLSSGVAAIAAGHSHTCSLTMSGGVKCWGQNLCGPNSGGGALGDGTTTNRFTPVDVSGLDSGVAAISAGFCHSCALTASGGAKCWGRNSTGQLGDGTQEQRLTPVDVAGLSNGVAAIAPGWNHTCALTNSGGVKCWGNNGSGALGDGSTIDRLLPVAVVTGGARGDVNADRNSDLFWRESAPGRGLSWWIMSTRLGSPIGAPNYFEVGPEWQVADVGDLDSDGRSDIVWRRATDGATYVWMLDGLTIKGFANFGILDPAQWTLTGIADLDGDGKGDLVWRGADGTVYAWLMNGSAIATQGVIGNPGTQWVIADLSDMDGDGKADIVFRNVNDGGVYIYFMNGLATASGGFVGIVEPAAWTLVGTADFSGDGKVGLLWRHTSGDMWVWLMNGAAFQSAHGIGNPGAGWSVRSFGDFDGDGKDDLVWRHTDGTTYWWKMNGASAVDFQPIANPAGIWQIVGP